MKWKVFQYHIQNRIWDLFFALGTNPKEPKAGEITVLAYHGLVPDDKKSHPNSKFITQTEFEAHLKWYNNHFL